MWLFKRKLKRRLEESQSDSIGTRLGKGIVKLQTAFAVSLNTATAKLSVRKLKMALLLFCLVSGGVSLYLATSGVLGKSTKKAPITIDQASVPKHFDKSGDEIRDVQNSIDDELYGQVKAFRAYMDSLQINNKVTYDSILLLRPGLLDSITLVEQIYLSQQIK
ncbi:MAG: hypothetical protein EOP48_15360 [Sphingobacteriales bacterium]|nr:MAG: hypothetical protein EOP48_15360 [Sphingobacteriales bacterium]